MSYRKGNEGWLRIEELRSWEGGESLEDQKAKRSSLSTKPKKE